MKIVLILLLTGLYGGGKPEKTWQDLMVRLLEADKYYTVLHKADSMLQMGREEPLLFYYKGKACEGVMRYNEAYRCYRQWYETDTNNIAARLILARLATLSGHRVEAIRRYEQLSGIDSLNFAVNYALGRLYQQTGKPEKALEAYGRQLAVDTANITLMTRIGECYADIGLIYLTLQYYCKAFNLDTHNSTLALKTVNTLLANRDLMPFWKNQVMLLGREAIKQSPESFLLRESWGVFHYADRQYEATERIFRELLQQRDSSRLCFKYMGMAVFQQQKYHQALKYLERAYKMYRDKDKKPTDLEVAMKYAEALGRTDACRQAFVVLSDIEELIQPDDRLLSQIALLYGMAYSYTGEKDKAVKSYWEAYQRNPRNKGAVVNLAYLASTLSDEKTEEYESPAWKQKYFFHVLFLQKVKGKPGETPDKQHMYSRKVLQVALEEMFFRNQKNMTLVDPDGKEYVYTEEDIRKLIQ